MFPIDEFRAATIEQVNDVKISSLRYVRNRRVGPLRSFFRLPLTTTALRYEKGMGLIAWLFQQKDSFSIFEINNPYPEIATNSGLNTSGNLQKGHTQAVVSGLPGSRVKAIRSGDFIRFGGHAKVYMVTIDSNSSASGIGTINFTPELQQEVSPGTSVFYGRDVVFQVCIENAVSAEVSSQESNFIVIDVELVEQG